MKFFVLTSFLVLFSSCQKNETDGTRYSLIQYSGTIAGITKNFQPGQCIWNITDTVISIDISVEDNYVRDMKTFYIKTGSQGNEFWAIDSLGSFAATYSQDTLFLTAPCCDFIDYTLLKD